MLTLIKDATSSITLEDIIKEHKGPNTNVSLKNAVETLGNVEGSVEVSTFNILCMAWISMVSRL